MKNPATKSLVPSDSKNPVVTGTGKITGSLVDRFLALSLFADGESPGVSVEFGFLEIET